MGTYSLTLSRSNVSSFSQRKADSLLTFASVVVAIAAIVVSMLFVGLVVESTTVVIASGLIAFVTAFVGMLAGLRLALNRR